MSEKPYKHETSLTVIGFYEGSKQRYASNFLAHDAMEAQLHAITVTRYETDGDDRVVPVGVMNAIGALIDSDHCIGVGDLGELDGILLELYQQASSMYDDLSQRSMAAFDFLASLEYLSIDDSGIFDSESGIEPGDRQTVRVAGEPIEQLLVQLGEEVRDYYEVRDVSKSNPGSAIVGYFKALEDCDLAKMGGPLTEPS